MYSTRLKTIIINLLRYKKKVDFHLIQTNEATETPALALAQVLLDEVGG